ncbi:MAG: Arc family DNA-binding protein [Gemmatimonadaceae bacterium]
MADKKPFLMRVDRELLEAIQRWANDELRSVNGQVEFLLRDALKRAGRTPKAGGASRESTSTDPETP